MNEGFLLYRDFDAVVAPLTASVYQFIDWVFGRSQIVYQLLSFLFMYIQCVIFNLLINRIMVFSEKTYLPAFIYGICASLFFDFYTLSPVILSLTFLLLALGELYYIVKEGASDERSFYMGFYLSMGILFFTPASLFVVVFFLGSVLYTNLYFKGYLIFVFGLFFPTSLLLTFYYWNEGTQALLGNFFYSSFSFTAYSDNLIGFNEIIIVFVAPALFLIVSIFKVFNSLGFINYQVRIQSIMLLWIIVSIVIVFLIPQLATYHFLLFIPSLTLFVSAMFLNMTKVTIRAIVFYSFLGIMIHSGYSHKNFITPHLNLDKLIIPKSTTPEYGKILVLGEEKEHYVNNKTATIYLDWNLSKRYFMDLDNYYNISRIYTNLKKDLPVVIIDNKEVVPKLFQRIPELEKLYEKEGDIYKLKNRSKKKT